MKELLDAVEKDKSAGVRIRSDGVKYFVQRKVEFQTIDFDPEYIFSKPWDIFDEPLKPIQWNVPECDLKKQLILFSKECSKRFRHFWYRYIDVMLGRSLANGDKNIFRKDLIRPSIFLDLGISRDPLWANVPVDIHKKIMEEYDIAIQYEDDYKIYYLSDYLKDLTTDINEYLKPYQILWEWKEKRQEFNEKLKKEINGIYYHPFFKFLTKGLNDYLIDILEKIQNVAIRDFHIQQIYKEIYRSGKKIKLGFFERKSIIEFLLKNQLISHKELPPYVRNIYFLYLLNEYTSFPSNLKQYVKKFIFLEFQIYRNKISILTAYYRRYYHFSRLEKYYSIEWEKKFYMWQEKFNVLYNLIRFLNFEHNLYLEVLISLFEKENIQNIFEISLLLEKIKKDKISVEDSYRKRILHTLKQLSEVNQKIINFYKKSFSFKSVKFCANPKYSVPVKIDISFVPGNPFKEKEVLEFFRDLIRARLKPIRMASNDYSLLAMEKHGMLTLNPVLKLWKHQVDFQRELPEIIQLELNTPITIRCLLELIQIVDKDLVNREINWGRIVKQTRGKETIQNMMYLLVPGSCYPIKEIPSSHFPEFKYKIIGEERPIKYVGVDETHYILTGCWYHKKNHTLYYSVGGDNAKLLKRIYIGIHSNVIPAFFFAIGQFVFECLPSSVLYYKTTEMTFQEVLIKIQKQKDYVESEIRNIRSFDKEKVKFRFAILYSLLIMEHLTGAVHIQNRVPELYQWFSRNLNIDDFFRSGEEERRIMRSKVREIIEKYEREWQKQKNQR